ncbi:hypothetical protein C8A00DRAFT_33569 [Chaetomidium leptoderma]|uniref:Pentatricopeptide repeat protein n=1 Tax=Chaetomidium leptoderma TaxID=669021 RepID=A0AAN6VLC8_9PEZI|nr:hypothetical protein C8A00DRAFT_33569 [Chaetomidium leptoderma]
MFVCRGCLRSLTGMGVSPIRPRLLGPLQRTTGSISSRHMYMGRGIKVDLRSAIGDPIQPGHPGYPTEKERAVKPRKPLAENEEDLEYENIGQKGGEFGRQKYEQKLETAVRKSLSLTTDPFFIAQHVELALGKGSFDEALLMTRIASRNTKVEVSWNHLIDYQMKNRRLHAAVKLYNEMKKRAQIPNAKTYTIIFRGCAHSLHPKLAVAEATRIYNFMIKQGALKPNTIHMNAVLEVCARAGDLESLFTVLATANKHLRAPDAHTYTIVLNALRHDAGSAHKANLGLVDAEVKREYQNNIQRARAIWADVIANWRGGKMIVDEHLVYAMGKTLVTGDYKDNDSVLELLEQTMNIPRFDKPNVKLPSPTDPSLMPEDEAAAGKQAPDTAGMSPKDRRALALSRANTSPLYAKPGNKTLSLILTVLTNTRKTSSAAKYWSYFTQVLHVMPDAENKFCHLRALANGHASAQVAAFIESMPQNLLNEITFRRGFSGCIGDNLNKDAFKNACRIFDVMVTTQRYPDALAMRLFLQVARANTRHFHEQQPQDQQRPQQQQRQKRQQFSREEEARAEAEEEEAEAENTSKITGPMAHGRQIAMAIERMWDPFRILSGAQSYPEGATRSPQEEADKRRGDTQEVMATARRMIAAIDRVVNEEGMASRNMIKLLRTRRIILQKAVERWVRKLYPDGAPPPGEEEEEGGKKKLGPRLHEEPGLRESARHAARLPARYTF